MANSSTHEYEYSWQTSFSQLGGLICLLTTTLQFGSVKYVNLEPNCNIQVNKDSKLKRKHAKMSSENMRTEKE